MASGMLGLVAALILGFRAEFDPDMVNTGQTKLPFTILSAGLLWFGWMGSNGGSAFVANGYQATKYQYRPMLENELDIFI